MGGSALAGMRRMLVSAAWGSCAAASAALSLMWSSWWLALVAAGAVSSAVLAARCAPAERPWWRDGSLIVAVVGVVGAMSERASALPEGVPAAAAVVAAAGTVLWRVRVARRLRCRRLGAEARARELLEVGAVLSRVGDGAGLDAAAAALLEAASYARSCGVVLFSEPGDEFRLRGRSLVSPETRVALWLLSAAPQRRRLSDSEALTVVCAPGAVAALSRCMDRSSAAEVKVGPPLSLGSSPDVIASAWVALELLADLSAVPGARPELVGVLAGLWPPEWGAGRCRASLEVCTRVLAGSEPWHVEAFVALGDGWDGGPDALLGVLGELDALAS